MKSPVQEFEKAALPLMTIAVRQMVNVGGLTRNKTRLDSYYDYAIQGLFAQLSTYMVSNKVHEQTLMKHKYPESWVEAFKEKHWRFIPSFLKRRFPIRHSWIPTRIDHVHVCPHCADIPWGDGAHMTFMTTDDTDYHGLSTTAREVKE